jgi:Domain of unknown function (DUF4430)
VRVSLVLLLVLAGTGCGGENEHGTATLWVTRDRGSHLVYSGTVPAGLTAMQALDRKLDITTRYGGRFVQSIGGIDGSVTGRRDWFYFLDGIEGDRSAAETKLHDGDVEWWDYRSWRGKAISVPFVVGAYPHPFLRGTTSVTAVGVEATVARTIAGQVHGTVAATKPTRNYIVISRSYAPERVAIKRFRDGALLELGTAVAHRLAADPTALQRRYGVAP